MDSTFAITTSITILLALLSYTAAYWNNLRLSQRKERLERINKQLSELYGPLFALVESSGIAWDAFRKKYRPNRNFFDPQDMPSEEEEEVWRLWMSTVFIPINEKMFEIIQTKSDLLLEAEMPQPLLSLCAHIAAYKPIKEKWGQGDYTEHTSLIEFPSEPVRTYIQTSYKKLKSEQTQLLGD